MEGRATIFANVLSLLGAFVATAMVMGLLAAGLMIPAVGATGRPPRASVEIFDALPSEFSRPRWPSSPRISTPAAG